MKTSDHGLQFIAGWEGIRNRMYDDGGPGVGNATIGIGHLIHLGPIDGRVEEAPYINGLSDDECFALMRVDVRRFEDVVNAHAQVTLNQNQFDALVDFSFNTGGGYPSVWRAANMGEDVAAVLAVTAILPAWATAALVRRRKAEGALYNTPYEEDEMAERVWCSDRFQTWIIGKHGAAPVLTPDMDKPFQALYGGHTRAMTGAELDALKPK